VIVVLWKILPGTDEAMMFDLVTSLRITCWIRETSVVGSILQPSSEVFQLFDCIIVLDKSCFKDPIRMHSPILRVFGTWKKKNKKKEEENGTCVHTYIHTYIHRENLYVLFSGGVVTCYCFSE